MMRILEIGKFYPPHFGGIETLLRSWCEGFVRKGAQVDCVVANEGGPAVHETVNGVHVHRLRAYGMALSTSLAPGVVTSPARYPADLLHFHFPNPLADLAAVLDRTGTPLVLSYHSDIVRQAGLMRLYRPLLKGLLARAQAIVVATPAHIQFSPWLPAYKQKCHVIPFGINLARFALTDSIRERVEDLRKPAYGKPVLLTIGRLVGYKGQRYLIEAMQDIDALLWIVGTGPLEESLRALVQKLGVQEKVQFLGAVADMNLPAVIHACEIFVLPSITPNEAFGIVQVEAMACGKPVVSCQLDSGVPYVNLHGVTGHIVPPADAGALARSINQLLGHPPLRERLGANGQARAQAEFSEQVMIDRYWDLFGKVGRNT